MTWRRKGVIALALLLLGYATALWVADDVLARRVRANLTARLQAALGGEVAIGAVELSLWRGTASIRDLSIARGDGGAAAGTIALVSARFARGGAVLWSRELHELRLGRGRVALSLPALGGQRRPPPARLLARRVIVDELVISVAPSASWPRMLASELTLRHVVSGRTRLRSPVSWLESVQQLDGMLRVPLVGALEIALAKGRLTLRGSLLPRAISMAYAPPVLPDTATDRERIEALLVHVARGIGAELGAAWAPAVWNMLRP